MKVAIASSGTNTDSQVDERFGRADYFLITNEKGDQIEEIIENNSKNSQTGAGTGSASLIAEKGVKALFAGNLGPKAESVISAAGINFISFQGTVAKAMEVASKGSLPIQNPDLETPPKEPAQEKGARQGQAGNGPAVDQRRGKCQGQGRGMGGQGRGMGQGKGMGGGGCKRGMGRNQGGRS